MFSRKKTEAKSSLLRRFTRFKKVETDPFQHTPLNASIDGIRLLTLEPASSPDAVVKTSLHYVTFAEKPKYEALSYTWGDETADRERISINEKEFVVGRNLYEALKHIRHRDRDRILWIDAICINQANVPEKNQQIRMMPFTYSKASQVLIWLDTHPGADPTSLSQIFASGASQLDASANRSLVNLCRNAYWRRVWIIQEIGLARRISIHCKTYNMDWERFIFRVQSCQECHNSIPLKFQRQLDDKYSSGHKLQTLIETHKGSLCKEPRDHDSPQHDILRFAKTVQTLLGGRRIASRDDVQSEILLHMTAVERFWDEQYKLVHSIVNNHDTTNDLIVPARVVGRISYLGPTYHEIISDTKKILQWKSSITRLIPEDQLPSAREENDLFLEVLENIKEQELEAIASYDRVIAWEPVDIPRSLVIREEEPKKSDPAISEKSPSTPEPRLFLLSGTKEVDPSASGKMGLAPPETQEGDFVCQVQGITKAVIVRKRIGLGIVGTAVVAENKFLARARRDSQRQYYTFGTAQFDLINTDDRIDLSLDIATAYDLLN
ncbi:heterokaryon incompatibility protein-domain-containing protein [Rhexocercosporidium sp. MPI-PUGE-AT-0058]|nr:heterokaryon incompatibility protein-domain-containing protein [Rhexocercosporidium sp. MPI-PUGE-AT-0058]